MENSERKIEIGDIIAGLNVIVIGIYLLLGITGTLNFAYLPSLLKLWPIILIAIGLGIIFRAFNVKYVGSVIITLLLVLVIIASVPGITGSGVRKIFGIPEEPIGWNIDKFVNMWTSTWDGKVIETKTGTVEIPTIPSKISITLSDDVRNVKITLKKGEKASYTYKYEILDQVMSYVVGFEYPDTDKNAYQIKKIDTNGKSCNAEFVISCPTTVGLEVSANLRKLEISDDWVGDLYLGNTTNCEIVGKNVGKFAMVSASGSIKLGNCTSCTISTASADISVGDVAIKAEIKTASGEVYVGNVKDAVISTISGDISAASISSTSSLTTVSGEIMVRGASNIGDTNISTTSGTIGINNLSSNKKVIIGSVSGDVKVSLAKDANIQINVSTLSGDTNIVGEEIMPAGNYKRTLVIGKEGGVLNIETTSGDIGVTQ